MKWTLLLTRDASILLKYLVIKGIRKGPRFVLPEWGGVHNQLWTWDKNGTGIHYLYTELHRFSEVVKKKSLEDSQFVKQYKKLSKDICDEVVNNIKIISQKVNSNLTNNEINELFKLFCNEYSRLGDTILMSLEEIQNIILPKLKDVNQLGILTSPTELSLVAKEELERLEIIKEIELKYKDIFMKGIKDIKKRLQEFPEIHKKIQKHVKKYCWIPLNFEKEIWDIDFFLHLFRNYLKDSYNYHKRKEELKKRPETERKEKREIMNKLDRETKILINLLKATAFIRLYRANIFSLAFYEAYPVLKKVGRCVGLPLSILKSYTPPEISEALIKNKKLSKNGISRKNSFVILILNNSYYQYEGEEAQKVIKRERPKEEIQATDKIKGMCAYPGKVKGKVKLVFDARECNKINKGDILVCKETNPDLVIVMSKSGAIVTDEGGITCHAAVVSREMKKPCVIGTKIATKVFKDGDLVEVDADKGIVKIIKRR